MASHALWLSILVVAAPLAGCLVANEDLTQANLDDATSTAPALEPATPLPRYEVREPDLDLGLLEHDELVPTLGPEGDVEIHVRMVRPDVDGPVPVIVQFTPYTAPLGMRNTMIEPMVAEPSDTFVREFVRRGFAFAYADVRGTGDSSGCLDLRGQLDIEDAWHLTEYLGTQDWSNGKVGFIGASYPGSEAHIAALANNEHLGGVVPVVASTSFYHYHHKGGVPYVNHLSTNSGYTAFATAPTHNPHMENYAERHVDEAHSCDQDTHLTKQTDQSGTYDAWWVDRNLRWRVSDVEVPVLMAQGLADWNVKPDHIDTWYNDLDAPKTLIAGQWGHQYPEDTDLEAATYGNWWEYVTAFFDETLRGEDTGLFTEDRAFVQRNDGTWFAYPGQWPPLEAEHQAVYLQEDGLSLDTPGEGEIGWHAVPGGGSDEGVLDAAGAEPADQDVTLGLGTLDRDLHVSGTPYLDLTITSTAENVHLTAVLLVDGQRQNHGYLNPTYRNGIDEPVRLIPGEPTPVTIRMYPQEDLFEKGSELTLVLSSVDEGRTVPVFDEATIAVDLSGESAGEDGLEAKLHLPLGPLQG